MERYTAHCHSCGAPILWVKTSKGSRMPLDAEPNSSGNWVIHDPSAPNPDAVRLPNDAAAVYKGEKYQSHFETCPEADQWSQRRRA